MTAPTPAEWPAVLALLRASALPTADLADADRERFVVARRGGGVVGCVAVEPYGDAGLLRSLAVAPEARGTGLGRRLVAAAEDAARAAGLQELVLLTTTAAPFFASLGWAPVDRADVSEALRASSEFAGLCPASAACLGKALGPTGIGAPGTGGGR